MKFVISVFSDNNQVSAPVGYGVLTNDSNDLEEKAQGEITIADYTLQASLALTLPEVAAENPNQVSFEHMLYDEKL